MRVIPLFVLLFVLLFLSTPVSAATINPSVESQPWYCRASVTKWICNIGGGAGAPGPAGPAGSGGSTFYYNSTSNESIIYSNQTSFFNTTIGNNLTTFSNYTYWYITNITQSEMNQTPGPQGPQGIQGIPGPEGPMNQTPNMTAGPPGSMNMTPNMTAGPQGIQGPPGPQGEDGEQGERGEDGLQGEKGEKGDKGDTGAAGPMNMTPNMTAGPMNMTMNQTVLDLSWNTSYQTIANQSAYDIAVNTSMKNYADFLVAFKGVRAHNASDYGFAASGWRSIKYYAEKFDTNTFHDLSTNNDRLTAPVDGYYYIEAQAAVGSDSSSTTTGLKIDYNGTLTISQNTHAGLSTYDTIQTATIYYLPAGAFVNSSVYSSKSSPKIYYFDAFSPVFEMYRIG